QRLQGVVVRVGEVDVRLALLGDRHGGGRDVAGACHEGRAGLQTVEPDVLHGEGQVELLGDRVQEVDVEAGVARLTVSILELERRVGDVRAHRQRPRLDQAVLVASACGRLLRVRAARAAGEGQGGGRDESETEGEVTTLHGHSRDG